MTHNISNSPNPEGPPVRKWLDGSPPIAGSLGEIRTWMANSDTALVDELFDRYTFVLGAALFKADKSEVRAPEQQVANMQRAISRAKEIAPEDERFHQLIQDIWQFLVPKFVEVQSEAFERTRPVT